MRSKWMLAIVLWTAGFGVLSAQAIVVTPSYVLDDESAVIQVSGLQPNEHVSILGELIDGAEQHWASEAEFVADVEGAIDTSKQAPIKGSYSTVSAMGLVWSMMPNEKQVTHYVHPRNLGPQKVIFRLVRNRVQVSSVELEQRVMADGVQTVRVQGQIHGLLFEPTTSERRPGILVVGGSEGGVPVAKALWLASHGYAALALAYFRYENLPSQLEAIPLEYFGRAIQWMMERTEVLPDQIAVVGTSRGGELALQLGTLYTQIKAVVAYVPANIRYPACCRGTSFPYAWTWGGQPLAYISPRFLENPELIMTASIAVEHTQGPILMISGDDDGIWQSSIMAEAAVGRLKMSHFSYPVTLLRYPRAGHLAGRPEIIPAWTGKVKHPISGTVEDYGGTAEGNAQSSLDAIPKVLAFLCQSLQSCLSKN